MAMATKGVFGLGSDGIINLPEIVGAYILKISYQATPAESILAMHRKDG
jgi:hypothetical protein